MSRRRRNASLVGRNNSLVFSVAATAPFLFIFSRRRFFRSRSSSKRKKDNDDNASSSAEDSPNSSVSLSSDVLLEDASTAASLAILEREKEKDVEIYLQFKAFCEDDNNNNKARAAQSNQTNQMSTDDSSPPASPIMMGASSSAAVNILPLARFLQEEMCHDEWRGATEHGMCCARHAYIPTYTSPFTT